ncbi:hypothetical protein MCQ_00922, partial [Candidatus Bartonella washoeensis Sb944nv]
FVATHGAEKSNSKLTSLQNGDISATSTDAVAGNQLYSLGSEVAKSFGGNAGYEDGQWTAPSFKVKTVNSDGSGVEEQSYETVAEAFAGVGTSFTNIHNEMNKEIGKVIGDSLVKRVEETNVITIGKEIGGTEIILANNEGKDRTLSGVKAGQVGNEAVNKAQLDENVKNLSESIGNTKASAVHYDNQDGQVDYTSVTLGGKDKDPVGLHNVANGNISKDSHDAINGSQINTIFGDVAKFLGGNTSFENGTFKGPIYNLSRITTDGMSTPIAFTDVGSAFVGLDTNIKNVNERIKEVSQGVAQDSLSWNEAAGAFVAKHGEEKTNSKIKFLANGDISTTSTDAVNGSQLHSLGGNVATYFGGGAKYEDGAWIAPSFKVKTVKADGAEIEDKSYNDVASAFEGVGASFTNITNEIKKEISTVQGNALLWSNDKEAFVATHGENKANSKITSLQAGKIASDSTDAVNGGQLYILGSEFAKYFGGGAGYENGQWVSPTFKVKTIKDDGVTVEEKKYDNVAEALADVGTSFTNIKNDITNVVSDSLVKQDEETKVIKIGSEKYGDKITLANSEGKDRTLSGVKAAEHANEAVNKAQLDESLKDLSKSLQSDESAVVHYDKKGDDNNAINYASVTFGKGQDSAPVALHNVADGKITKDSHDAINGSQINTISGDVAKFLGGNASFENGTFTGPTYKLSKISEDGAAEETSYDNVGSAFSGLDTNIKNVNQRLKEVSQGVAQDSLSWNGAEGAFVATHGENKNSSKITSILDGTVSESSTDAITGSQLHSLGSEVATYFGGGARYEEGKWTAPSFVVNKFDAEGKATEEKYDDVATAFAGVSSSLTNIHNEVKNEINKVVGDSLVKQDKEADAITIGKETNGTEISILNKEKASRTLSGLKAGTLSETSTEAINGAQLFATNQNVTAVTNDLKKVTENTSQYLGGGANVLQGEKPTYTVEGKTYNDVGSAFAGVDTSITNVKNDVTNVKNELTNEIMNQINSVKGDSLVKRVEETNVITIGKEIGGTEITLANSEGKARTLSGVKAAENDNEAVNKSQLDKSLKKLSDTLQSEESAVVLYDKGTDGNTDYSSVTFGKGKGSAPVALHNVKAGKIAENSYDAINGSQINTISEDVAKFLGGGAGFTEGIFTGPTYKISHVSKDGEVTESGYNDVGSAFAGLDTSISNVNTHLTNEIKKFEDNITNITQAVQGDALLWSDTAHAFVATHGEEKNNSKIKFLANGDISLTSTDAVAGNQLYFLGTEVAKSLGGGAGYAEGKWTVPTFTVKSIKEDGSGVEEQNYASVASAFEGVGTSFTNLHNEVKNEINKVVGDSLVKRVEETNVITIGKEIGGTEITLANNEGKDRTLSGVKAAENDNDAVNKAQLDESLRALSNSLQSAESAVVLYDKKEDGETDYSSVTFGKGKDSAPVALHNVANGQIADGSHDVVNGSQINTISQEVAQFLGGNASFENGTFKGPIYEISHIAEDGAVTSNSYSDVGSAFAGLDTSISNVNTHLKNEVKKFEDNITNITQAVQGDALLWDKDKGAFVAQHGENKGNSKITSLQNGDISENSTDAVNGGQLYSLSSEVAKYFGGGAGYENGKWIDPNFKVKQISSDGDLTEDSYKTVAEAFEGVGTSFTNIHNEINKAIGKVVSDSLVKQDDKTKVIKIGAEKDGDKITLANSQGEARTLSGVKAAENGNEAVNKSQLDKSLKELSDILQSEDSSVVLYDKKEDGETNYESVTFGKGTGSAPVALHNVADGNIGEGSHDAITGSQINKISEDVAKFLGGGAGFTDGAFTGPSYKISQVDVDGNVKKDEFTDVGSAFAGLDMSISNVNTHLTNEVKKFEENITNITQAVQSDSLLWDQDKGAFVAAHGEEGNKTNSKITSLQAGDISAISTDAVTGNQLYTLGSKVAKSLSGNASYENGAWIAPSFKVKSVKEDGSGVEEQSYETVAAAFEGVGTSFTNIHNEINKEIGKVVSDSLVKQDEATKVITIGVETDGTEISILNQEKASRTLSGLKAGTLSDTSTEAVNGAQLFATNQNVTSVTGDLENVAENTSQYLGGGADVFQGKKPTYTVEGKTYNDVGSAFAGVDTSITHVKNDVTNVKNELTKEITNQINTVKGDSLVKWNEEKKLIKIGGEKEGSAITFANNEGADRTLSGVKAAENDNEAVNKSQLDKSLKDLSDTLQSEDSSVVLYDTGTDGKTNYESVTFGKGKDSAPVALHNVADGTIGEGSHDAITGSQINKISEDVAKFLGGGAAFTDGAFTGPSYKLSKISEDGAAEETSYDNIGSAFFGLDTNIKNVNQRIKEVSQGVAQDSLLWDKDAQAFVATHGENKANSKITSILDGTVSESSTDAITGSQLHILGSEVAKSLGGGAGYAEGIWTAPSFTVKKFNSEEEATEEKYDNVAAAFEGVGNSLTNIHNEFKDEINNVISDSLVKQENETAAITIGKEAYGTAINIQNKNNEDRTLSGVKAAVKGNEAVNKSQLDKSLKDLSDTLQSEDSSVVLYDKQEDGETDYGNVTFGKGKGSAPVALHNVADGKIAKGSHDAVNGSQLFETHQTVAEYFGGGAGYAEGKWTAPSFTVRKFNSEGEATEEKYDNVAAAFEGVGNSLTNIHNEVKDEINNVISDSLVKQDEKTKVIKIGGEKDGGKITLANNQGKARIVSGVMAGALTDSSTEAINGSQLYLMSKQLAAYFGGGVGYSGGQWTAPEFKVTQFKGDGSSFEQKSYNDVASAFDGVSESMSSINERIKEVSKTINTNSLNWNEEKSSYDASHKGVSSKIDNVADGRIEKWSQEVVNGGQLWETNEKVKEVEHKVDSIDKHVKDIESAVTDGAVNYDKDTNGKKTNTVTLVGGNESDPVIIDNVGDGRIEVGSKEAVNGGQLHDYTKQQLDIVLEDIKKYTEQHVTSDIDDAVERAKQYTDTKFNVLKYGLEDVRKEARQAAAIGLAVANLRYNDTPGRLSFGFGGGLWRSQSALAFGAGYTSRNGNIRSNLSITSAGGHWGVGAGFTMTLD